MNAPGRARLLPVLAVAAWGASGAPGAAADCAIPLDSDGRIDPGRLAAALAPCSGTTADGSWAEVVDFGIYEIAYSAPDAQGNRVPLGYRHAGWDRRIPLSPGLIFGLRAVVRGGGEGGGDLETVIVHPATGSDPAAPRPADVTVKPFRPDTVEIVAFQMATKEEMVPGIWRIEIRRGGRILAAQSFELTPSQG